MESALGELADIKERWPRRGDSLFASGLDWELDGVLDRPLDWFLSYGESFKEAADAVVRAVENRSVSADSVAFATFFLYRHYVEIMLKGLIRVGHLLQDRTDHYPQHHRILDLWRALRPLLEANCPDGDPNDTQAVEECIKEFAGVDPTGQATRYGEDTHGNATFQKPTQINLPNMRDVVHRISGFFDGSYDWMHELLQYQADMDADSF